MIGIGRRPRLSVVVVVHNMQREAPRTLYSLSSAYQRDVSAREYEVIVVDSGSTPAFDPASLQSLAGHFKHIRVNPTAPTPCEAMNTGIRAARGHYVACAIDGARMLSPGVLGNTLRALQAIPHGLVCTMGMHLGPKRQTLSVSEGYCQAVEDKLLEQANWQQDGYGLFNIAVPAGSSQGGFLRPINESNFFTLKRKTLLELGGFDERFRCSGGGLVNLDMHNRMLEQADMEPVMLLGEATFHQFHGGVSTNVPAANHPLSAFKAEYRQIRGHEYAPVQREMGYFGHITPPSRRFLDCVDAL